MLTRSFTSLTALVAALALAHCTGGQSGHEGRGLDDLADSGPAGEGGDGGGSGAGAGGSGAGAGGSGPVAGAPGMCITDPEKWCPDVVGPCACREFVGRIALRGVIAALAQEADEIDARVEIETAAVLGPACAPDDDAGAPCPVAPGDQIVAQWNGNTPCGGSCASVAVGNEVLALYDPSEGRVALTRYGAPYSELHLDLGDGSVLKQDAHLLVEGGAACQLAVERASGVPLQADAGVAEPVRCNALRPPNLTYEDVCADSAAADAASFDCLDVCGVLFTCDDQVACDACLQRCESSPLTRQGRCLSLAIYFIDEEGCERMVQEYESFSDDYPCPE